ncbi:MAG: phospholipase/carboxylesterase [Bacteroidetes bacterium]|nr:MAG: phospholipase/carboxylesterase [Bacteroidota bacterium]
MKKLVVLWIILISLFHFNTSFSQDFKHDLFIYKSDTMPYRIMYPIDFKLDKTYPLIIVLHGAGERGKDNEKQMVYGKSFFTDSLNMVTYPAVVVYPQCAENDYWAKIDVNFLENGKREFIFRPDLEPTKAMTIFMSLLDSLRKESFISQDKIYLGGLSMGGMGTFELLYRKPDVFAAAFPICGGGEPETCRVFAKKTPVWAFHGEVDGVVPVDLSIKMVESLKKEGANPRLTIYPNVNHNAWDYVFLEKELLPWLFSHTRQ